jgi:DNA invertase Pin-like site-specific DNA recombinase
MPMKRIVKKIEPAVIMMPSRKRVAAYARVSLGTEHMLHSLAAQVSHYSAFIQNKREWDYAGVYADADETGTRCDRPEFQRMLADCRAGLVDMVLTKSISRFARNTVTLLETVRELKDLGVDIFFEEQGLHTLSGEGELLLTILASYAQEESRSVSENIKWRKRGDMKAGKTKPAKVYGYDVSDGKLDVNPVEAEVVRMMFGLYLSGLGQAAIANRLNEHGIASAWGSSWSSGTVRRILTNPKMCGNLLHQREFITDHISKKQVKNRGELPMYLIEGAHEGIVSRETYEAVQAELARRGGMGRRF